MQDELREMLHLLLPMICEIPHLESVDKCAMNVHQSMQVKQLPMLDL
jgi:hypothetical protein